MPNIFGNKQKYTMDKIILGVGILIFLMVLGLSAVLWPQVSSVFSVWVAIVAASFAVVIGFMVLLRHLSSF